MRIVVVEDEPAIADFLVRGLEAAGYAVALANDGPGGEKLILEGEADLVILDLMLPGRSGLDVLGAIRKVRPHLPVIILSAKGEIEDRIAGLDTGATDYVTKPFSVPELLARVRAHLRAGSAESGRLRAGAIQLDLLSRRVWSTARRWHSRLASSRCSPASSATPAKPFPATDCSRRPGDTSTTRAPTSSTSTSATCAASSAIRRRSRRSARPAIGSRQASRNEMSLRTRLTLSIGALVLVSVAALGLAVYNLVGSRLDDRVDSELADQVDALSGTIAEAPAGTEVTAARRFIDSQALAGSRLLVAQVPGVAAPISNQANLLDPADGGRSGEEHAEGGEEEHERAQVRELLAAASGYETIDLSESGELRLLTRTVPTSAGEVVVQAGEPAAATDQAQRQVAKTYLLIGSLTVLAAAGLGLLIATRTARPLERMARRAHEVDAGRLELRMEEHTRVTEIAALADSFDRMLDRLEAAFHSQRAFVADASHELRTPLTAILGQAQVLAADPDPDPAEVARVTGLIEREVERMGALVDGLLQLARLDSGGEPAEPASEFDLAGVAAEIVAALAPDEAGRVELDARLPAIVVGHREDAVRIARNLVANALAYGRQRVRVTAATEAGDGTLTVDDDGPGIPVAERERVFDRFARLDRSRSREGGGFGLGLAISRELASAQAGRIEVGDSPLGGARMALYLPSADAGQ